MDFDCYYDGSSLYLLTPVSDAAIAWADQHIDPDALGLGNAIAVEHRFIGDIIGGIRSDGLTVAVAA